MLLRPNGSFLSTSKGRYLVGMDMLVLMGIPIHRYNASMLSSRDALQKLPLKVLHFHSFLNSIWNHLRNNMKLLGTQCQ